MISRECYGWAIRHNYDGREYFLGRYAFGHIDPLPSFDGYLTGVFSTRVNAATWLRKRKQRAQPSRWAKDYVRTMSVRKVLITVELA